jgi:hypothetical protein
MNIFNVFSDDSGKKTVVEQKKNDVSTTKNDLKKPKVVKTPKKETEKINILNIFTDEEINDLKNKK